jgi:hypothetical protein
VRRALGLQRADLGELGQRAQLVAQLVGAGVERLQLEQGELGGGIGFQRILLFTCACGSGPGLTAARPTGR